MPQNSQVPFAVSLAAVQASHWERSKCLPYTHAWSQFCSSKRFEDGKLTFATDLEATGEIFWEKEQFSADSNLCLVL